MQEVSWTWGRVVIGSAARSHSRSARGVPGGGRRRRGRPGVGGGRGLGKVWASVSGGLGEGWARCRPRWARPRRIAAAGAADRGLRLPRRLPRQLPSGLPRRLPHALPRQLPGATWPGDGYPRWSADCGQGPNQCDISPCTLSAEKAGRVWSSRSGRYSSTADRGRVTPGGPGRGRAARRGDSAESAGAVAGRGPSASSPPRSGFRSLVCAAQSVWTAPGGACHRSAAEARLRPLLPELTGPDRGGCARAPRGRETGTQTGPDPPSPQRNLRSPAIFSLSDDGPPRRGRRRRLQPHRAASS